MKNGERRTENALSAGGQQFYRMTTSSQLRDEVVGEDLREGGLAQLEAAEGRDSADGRHGRIAAQRRTVGVVQGQAHAVGGRSGVAEGSLGEAARPAVRGRGPRLRSPAH